MSLKRKPVHNQSLRCDQCGQPALWRDRVVTSCCVLGEALCNTCESKSSAAAWWSRDDNFWREVAADVVWLWCSLTARFRKNN